MDPDLTELCQLWADPVVRENIMANTDFRSIPLDSASLDDAYDSFAIKTLMPAATTHLHKPVLGYTSMMISELLDLVDKKFTQTRKWVGYFILLQKAAASLTWIWIDSPERGSCIRASECTTGAAQNGNEHFANYPFFDNIDLPSGVDFLCGNWDQNKKALVLTLRSFDGQSRR
ncbi:unnamed protein product [Clonostachys chloroleuca]|uniref:Uncharacterized protein n=1 Tax=Clonostachys chloroleuca TaxID=1926264 RepID=A0AA35MDU3_9HYPO|nr:unnamed protein product [Clonostachys chloroleuca]